MIGFGKIALRARRLSRRHQFFDLRIARRAPTSFQADRGQLLIVIVFKHRKNIVECLQSLPHRCDVACPKIAAIHGHIRFANQLKDRRQCLGCVQIVFESVLELLPRLLSGLAESGRRLPEICRYPGASQNS